MYQSKPILASLFHPYVCVANLTFRACRIHHNITGAVGAYRDMSGSQQRWGTSFLEMGLVSPGSRRAPYNL